MVIGEMIIVEQYLRILEFQLFSEIQVLDHIIYVGLSLTRAQSYINQLL